jgi:hypothetical protein
MSMYSYCIFMYLHRASWNSSATLTEVFPCLFLNCKANTRLKPAKMGHGPHSSKNFVLFYILFVLCRSVCCVCVMCIVLLAPGGYPIAVNKYITLHSIRRTTIPRLSLNSIRLTHKDTTCCHSTKLTQRSNLLNVLNYNFSKEQYILAEDDRVIETCRSVLNVLM